MIRRFQGLILTVLLLIDSALGFGPDSPSFKVLYQLPNQTRIENIAVRFNGQILLSILTAPELLSINPFDRTPRPSVVYRFPNASALFGIAELDRDLFAVATANLSLTFAFPPNNAAIWLVDLRHGAPKRAVKAVELPPGVIINGLSRFSSHQVVGSDVGAGAVYIIDLMTGKAVLALQDETMMAPTTLPGYGINGIRTHRFGHVYYVNTGKGLYCRVFLDSTGAPASAVEIISQNVTGADDFALGAARYKNRKLGAMGYIANVFNHSLLEVRPDGDVTEVVRKSDGILRGPTSAQLGRTGRDRGIVYVVDSGSVFNPVTGGFDSVEGGKIVAVNL